jgi:hypothetical protein
VATEVNLWLLDHRRRHSPLVHGSQHVLVSSFFWDL